MYLFLVSFVLCPPGDPGKKSLKLRTRFVRGEVSALMENTDLI